LNWHKHIEPPAAGFLEFSFSLFASLPESKKYMESLARDPIQHKPVHFCEFPNSEKISSKMGSGAETAIGTIVNPFASRAIQLFGDKLGPALACCK
jgi:hypothetical protein